MDVTLSIAVRLPHRNLLPLTQVANLWACLAGISIHPSSIGAFSMQISPMWDKLSHSSSSGWGFAGAYRSFHRVTPWTKSPFQNNHNGTDRPPGSGSNPSTIKAKNLYEYNTKARQIAGATRSEKTLIFASLVASLWIWPTVSPAFYV